jgi:hypothetical protein
VQLAACTSIPMYRSIHSPPGGGSLPSLGVVGCPTRGCPTCTGGTNLCLLGDLRCRSQTPSPYDAYSPTNSDPHPAAFRPLTRLLEKFRPKPGSQASMGRGWRERRGFPVDPCACGTRQENRPSIRNSGVSSFLERFLACRRRPCWSATSEEPCQ